LYVATRMAVWQSEQGREVDAPEGSIAVFSRWSSVLLFLALAVLLWWIYDSFRLPPGVEGKGPQDWLPWISLAGAVLSLITGLIGLISKLIELRHKT
jgi:hypothetical protein